MSMITPIGKRVLITPAQGDTLSEAGLELSSSNNAATPVKGEIVKAGSESAFSSYIGRVVYFRRYSVDELKGEEKGREFKIYLVDDADIIAMDENLIIK